MRTFTRLLTLLALSSTVPQSLGALLSLSQAPLSLSTYLPPYVFLQLDDSGSMDWEVLTIPYWEQCAYDPRATGSFSSATVCGTKHTADDGVVSYANGNFLNFNYIYSNSDNVYGTDTCNDTGFPDNSIAVCPSSSNIDWRSYAPALNTVYYDPTLTYSPWQANCSGAQGDGNGTACANASFTNARSYPVNNQNGYTSTRNLTNSKYEIWIDDKGYSGTRPLRGSAVNVTNTPNGEVDLWDSHITVQFTTVASLPAVIVTKTTYAPTSTGLNPVVSVVGTLASSTACYNLLGGTDLVQSIFSGTLGLTSVGGSGCQTIAGAQQNFANWYQYSRRRALAARADLMYIIDQYPGFSYGFNTISNSDFIANPPSSTSNFSTYNNNIVDTLVNFQWQARGTPLRSALSRVGKYYAGTLSGQSSPITQACQQNYTILITDGYWNDPDANGTPSLGDVDGDGVSVTMADIAYYYYKNNLRPTLTANQVVPSAWDPATWLHMVTYAIGFGITGLLDAGSDGWPNPALAINDSWGNPFNNDAAKADDLWHAAFNSKGAFFGAQNPVLAVSALGKILSNIAQRATSSVPVSQNSYMLNSSSVAYQAVFNSSNWFGDILAYPLSTNGILSTTPSWSAGCMLTGGSCPLPSGTNAGIAANNRVIITRNWDRSATGIPFRWPSNYTSYKSSGVLPTVLTGLLTSAPYASTTTNSTQIAANQAYGTALVNYIRGDRTNESSSSTYKFRSRTSILGDIVNSAPLFVGPPNRNYTDSSYVTFKSTYANRIPMIFAGANDGMLHGFNANTGAEVLGYVPGSSQVATSLSRYSSTTYSHLATVDAPPTQGDVQINNAWSTMISGSLGNGGQSIYALDITDPSTFTEANADRIFLWEFSDQNDADLGYVQGAPIIAKVRVNATDSKWALIFGNGYNNSQADGYASTTGRAALYILMIEGGVNGSWVLNQNYYKIPVGTGSTSTPNGLATPFAVDTNADGVVDYVYAGDLSGNMWRFNLTSTSPSSWASGASVLFQAYNTTAGDQSITAPPTVSAHPNGIQYGVMVYFGTGKFLEPTDNTTTGQTTQSFYGIWDKLTTTTAVSKTALLQQQILGSVLVNGNTYRAVSNNAINWTTTGTQNLGWTLNLIEGGAASNGGERQISTPILRNNDVIFTTMAPSSNVCAAGGSSWVMEINASNGGYPTVSPFDINKNGNFSSADYLTITSGGKTYTVPAAGILSLAGATGAPAIYLAADKKSETKVLSGSSGLTTVKENPGTAPTGRQNWRQIN